MTCKFISSLLTAKLKKKKKIIRNDWTNGSLWNQDALCSGAALLWLFNFSEASVLRGLLLILEQLVCFQHNCWAAPVASAPLLFTAAFESVCSPAPALQAQHPPSRTSLWLKPNKEAAGIFPLRYFAVFLRINVTSLQPGGGSLQNMNRRHFVVSPSAFLNLNMPFYPTAAQRSTTCPFPIQPFIFTSFVCVCLRGVLPSVCQTRAQHLVLHVGAQLLVCFDPRGTLESKMVLLITLSLVDFLQL